MTPNKLLILLLASSCASCASYYQPPTAGPQSTLRISAAIDSRPGGVALAQVFASDKCDNTGSGNRLAIFTTNPGIQGKGSPHSGVDIPIPADREFIYSFYFIDGSAGVSTSKCAVTLAFQPTPGGRYHTHLELQPQSCAVVLLKVDSSGREEAMVAPAVRKIDPPCINDLNG